MALPPKLETELAEIRRQFDCEVIEDAQFINIVFRQFPLGHGYLVSVSDLLLRVPRSYPDSGPDMFWTEPSVLLNSGQVPQAADSVEPYFGKSWRRFSWHRASWNPTVDNLHGQIEFIRRRLREGK